MDSIPKGPKGPHRPQQSPAQASVQGSVQKIPVGQKQIPPGQPVDSKPLHERKIDPFDATPVLAKPSIHAKREYLGADVKKHVMAMLGQMAPDVNAALIRRVSRERQQEMAARVAGVEKALATESVQKTLGSGALLIDLEDQGSAIDITLNYVMALALKLRDAQDDIRAEINADRSSVKAWMKGLKQYSQLQDAWLELHSVVTDICSNEPLAFEVPVAPITRTNSLDSNDSGVGDLMGLEDPWSQPQPLVSPQPVTLPPAAEARISQLEQKLGDTLEHLRHERSMSDRLQESQGKVEALTRGNQQLAHQYALLQKDVEMLRKQPKGADPEAVRKAEQRISVIAHENSELKRQLGQERESLKKQEDQITQLESALVQKSAALEEVRSSGAAERESFAREKQKLEQQISDLEQQLSEQVGKVSSLSTELTRLGKLNEELTRTVDRHQSTIASQESSLQSVTGELSAAKEELRVQEKQVSDLQKQLTTKTEEYDTLRSEHQSLIDSKQQLESLNEKDRSQHNLAITELKESLAAVVKEKEQLKVSLEESGEREEALDAKVKKLEESEAEFREKELEARSLHQSQLKERDEVAESQGEEIERQKERNTRQQQEISKVKEDLERERALKGQAEEQLVSERQIREQLKVGLDEKLQQEKQKTTEAEEALVTEQSNHREEIKALEDKLREQQEKYEKQLQEKDEESRGEAEALKLKLSETDREKDIAHQEELTKLQKTLESQRAESEEEKQELVRIHEEGLNELGETHKAQLREQEQKFQDVLAERRGEADKTLRDTEERLTTDFEKRLADEKKPLEDKSLRLETALSEEQGRLLEKDQELAGQKESLQSLSTELADLKQKLETAQEQQDKDRDTASNTQQQLRTALSALDEDKKKLDQEFADLQLKLKETESEQEQERNEAAAVKASLEKSLSELTGEKEAVDEEIAVMKEQVSTLDESLRRNQHEIQELEQERNTLRSEVSGLSTELEIINERKQQSTSVGIQTVPEVEVRVQDFIDGIGQQHSRSGSTSGFFSDDGESDLSEVDSVVMHSQTLYQRPGGKGKGKEIRLESMLENSFRQLRDLSPSDGQMTLVDIAFQLAIKGIESQKRKLDEKLQWLEQNESTLAAWNEPPSHSPLRKARIKEYEQFVVEVKNQQEKFKEHAKESEDHHRQKVWELSEAMDDYIGLVSFAIVFQKRRDEEFHQIKEGYSKLPESEVKTPEGRVDDIHISLKEVMKHEDQEVRDYVAGAYVKKAAAEILQSGTEAVRQATEDKVRQELVRFETCLRRLAPDALPLEMGKKLGPMGTQFARKMIDDAVTSLKQGYDPAPLATVEENPVRGEPGLVLARRMIEDPEIRPAILTLFSSLQPEHEGVKTDIDYYSASLAGLKHIREEFRLVDMPTMHELLTCAVHDLKSENSLLATEAQKQHRQTAVDKQGLSRRAKLLQRCDQFLEKENNPEAPAGSLYRGQSQQDGVMVTHPHRKVLDCFKEGGQVFVAGDTGTPATRGRLQVCDVGGVSEGLLNTFFEGASGGARLVTNDRASMQCIQVGSGDTQPDDVVFKYNARAKCWQVNLGGTHWNVDPGFTLDNPNMRIPFESSESGVIRRDWIPLKNLGGETAILALRKVPGCGRYFLYEKGVGDELVPRVIDAGDPKQEQLEAQFFYDAARVSAAGVKLVPATVPQCHIQVRQLKGASPGWLKKDLSAEQLQTVYDEAVRKVNAKPARCPIPVQVKTDDLQLMRVEESPYRKIQKNKQAKAAIAAGSDIKAEHTGSRLVPYNPGLYSQFSVAANFDLVGDYYIQKCREEMTGSTALLEEEARARDKFKREAFKKLTVFHGCELNPEIVQDKSARHPVEGTPEYALPVLVKVRKINSDHRMRLTEGLNAECNKLLNEVRAQNSEKLKVYTDRELLNFLMQEFEQGYIPEGLDTNVYTKQLTGIMLGRNDLEQAVKTAAQLDGLMADLQELERNAGLQAKTPAYVQGCQQWNLRMAMLATEQEATAKRFDSYTRATLDSATRARMSFECRAKTVLRDNQVEEVGEALKQITHAMQGEDGRMSRVSQKGTGWGKSTIVQMLSDHACTQNQGNPRRSVLVIAPESNQAELDITLGRYFAQKGMQYRTLDIENQYVKPARGQCWWTEANLQQIHNTLSGMAKETPLLQRTRAAQELRAPVGVSVKNIQILMQLRNGLQFQEIRTPEEERSLKKLDEITDLVRESMVFLDEWDRALMPPGNGELAGIAKEVSEALEPLPVEVRSKEIMQCHGQIVQGCKRKHLLSATVGSGYTAAVAADVTKAEKIKEQCHTDVFTTQQRFWHWLNCATPVYVHLGQPDGREKLFRQVVEEVGPDRQIVVFDGNHKEGEAEQLAVKDYALLSEERVKQGGQPRGVVYYDENKRLHKYEKNDPVYGVDTGAMLPKEEEEFLKANHGRDVDVVLTYRESIGTDAPQGPDSVGVYMGLLEQSEEGRTSLVAQQIGRMMRASGDLRKPQALYLAVNLDAIRDLPVKPEDKKQFTDAYEVENKALAEFSERLGVTPDELTAEQKALIYQPLQITPPDTENVEEMAAKAEEAMTQEVERLADEEWPRHGLTDDQINALKNLKKAQWRAKKACLLLTAAELARREKTAHTKHCETMLHKASIASHLDKVYADEYAWLQSGMDGQVEECTLEQVGFKDRQVKRYVRHNILNAVTRELKAIPRRVVPEKGSVGGVAKIEAQISPVLVTEEIKNRVTRLKEEGFNTGEWRVLDEPAYNPVTPKPDAPVPSVREVLVKESVQAFDEAIKRTNGILGRFYVKRTPESSEKIRPIGIEQIEALRDRLQQKAQVIRQADDKGVQEALKSSETIDTYYRDLMRLISWVGFDGLKVVDHKPCEAPFDAVCKSMEAVMTIPKGFRAKAQNVGKPTWSQDDKFKKMFEKTDLEGVSFKKSVQHRAQQQTHAVGSAGSTSGVYRLAWKKELPRGGYKDVFTPPQQAVKPEAVSNRRALQLAVEKAREALTRQRQGNEARDLCLRAPGTDTALFEQSMDEVLGHVQKCHEQYAAKVMQSSKQEELRMKQQAQLMQVPLVKAL